MTRSVDRFLVVLLVLLLVPAMAGAVLGLTLVAQDLETSGEWLDGVGLVFGLGILGLAAVPGALAVVAIRALRQNRPTGPRWAIAAGVLGCLAVLPFGFFQAGYLALLPLPVVLAVAAGTAARER
jgi:hypothetical protein